MDQRHPTTGRKQEKEYRVKRRHSLLWLFYIIPPLLIGTVVLAGVAFLHATEPPSATRDTTQSSPEVEEPIEPPQSHTEDPNAPRIYLTFDDGPSETSTLSILNTLDTYEVKATFFVLGYMAETYPEKITHQFDQGHVIANHGYSHDYGAVYASADAFMANIERCEQVLTAIIGEQPPRITRFPAGSAAVQLEANPTMRDEIKSRLSTDGWRFFDWDVSFGDSILEAPQPGELGTRLIGLIDERVNSGATDIVVLGHDVDSKPWTPIDLPMVIEHCLNAGYVFKTLQLDTPPVEYR